MGDQELLLSLATNEFTVRVPSCSCSQMFCSQVHCRSAPSVEMHSQPLLMMMQLVFFPGRPLYCSVCLTTLFSWAALSVSCSSRLFFDLLDQSVYIFSLY